MQEMADDNGMYKMPDLLVPAHSASLANVWAEIQQKDVDFSPDISKYSSQQYHQISCGCHTWEMPYMGTVVQSSATSDARLLAVLTGKTEHLRITHH